MKKKISNETLNTISPNDSLSDCVSCIICGVFNNKCNNYVSLFLLVFKKDNFRVEFIPGPQTTIY